MRLRLRPGRAASPPLLPIYAAVSLFSIGAAYGFTRLSKVLSPILCPMLVFSGIPCPTCGATRALAALATGDWRAAVAFNPLIAITAVSLLGAGTVSILRSLTRRPAFLWVLEHWERRLLRLLILLLVAANWAYLVHSL